jgi:DNA-binding GntR family transcriptional regulator
MALCERKGACHRLYGRPVPTNTKDLATDQVPIKHAIAQALREAIVDGEFRPGEKLSEARLAERFGVSRTPVREALKELEVEDLVTVRRRSGTFVKQLTRREVMELYEVREAIEGMAARLCAERASAATLKRIDRVMARLAKSVDRDDGDAFLKLDSDLHELIFIGADNQRLTEQYRILVQHMHREQLGFVITRRPGRLARSFAEHEAIVHALHDRSPDGAEFAMRTHVQRGRAEIAEALVASGAPENGDR